jgi:hypothetical protein
MVTITNAQILNRLFKVIGITSTVGLCGIGAATYFELGYG